MKSSIAAVAVVLSLLSASAQAVRIVPIFTNTQQFNFSGACTDCNQSAELLGKPATAELVLHDYTLGTAISANNFVSFHYDGSDLFGAFTIDSFSGATFSGSMPTVLPGDANFGVQTNQYYFSSALNGNWSLGTGGSPAADFGTNGSFSTNAVPEPGSAALLGLGLLGLAALRRKGAGKA